MIYCLDFLRANSAVRINASAGIESQPPPLSLPLMPEDPPETLTVNRFDASAYELRAETVNVYSPALVNVPESKPLEL